MKKPIIGIVSTDSISYGETLFTGNITEYKYVDKIKESGGRPFAIVGRSKTEYIDKEILSLCDGFIIQGGNDVNKYHLQIIKYAYRHNVPLLGICLGMQAIGVYSKGKLKKINSVINHNPELKNKKQKKNIVHKIKIEKDSVLSDLFNSDVYVNSRHNEHITGVKPPFKVIARSNDDIIEAIECTKNDRFIIGVQWHPEDMNSMNKLFKRFIDECSSF